MRDRHTDLQCSPPRARRPRVGFTVTELLVVVGLIVVLLGLLLPALGGVWKTGQMTDSMGRMRQIALWMTTYSSDNRETVLPSQFNYVDDAFPGKVRSVVPAGEVFDEDWESRGTWTDILWTVNELSGGAGITDAEYEFNSPDAAYYAKAGQWSDNPLRSSEVNTKRTMGTAPLPFGTGAQQDGLPGYFAANNFFNADADSPTFNAWFAQGQILYADRSMYLVDSFAGETIEDDCEPFDNDPPPPGNAGMPSTAEVDFRYGEVCLMLFLDGHVEPEGRWLTLDDLQQEDGRGLRIQDLDRKKLPDPCDP